MTTQNPANSFNIMQCMTTEVNLNPDNLSPEELESAKRYFIESFDPKKVAAWKRKQATKWKRDPNTQPTGEPLDDPRDD